MKGFIGPYRRTAITATAALASLAATALLTGATVAPVAAGEPATTKSAGTANAIATSYKINPTTASLSIGITFGTSLAGYTNQVAQAESRGIDLGIIGSTLAGEGCDGGEASVPAEDQPQPLRADSRDANASQPRTEQERYVPLITKSVRADSTPASQADTTTAGLTAPGAFVDLSPAHSRAVTHLVNGTREAIATVDVENVSIAGILELSGLHWSAVAQSGAIDKTAGTFTIGKLEVLGQALPTTDAFRAIENANLLLRELGLQIVYPQSRVAAGILFVEPLMIRVVPSQNRDTLAQMIIGSVQPIREEFYAAMLEQDCGNATYITVSDIIIGSLTGAGSFSLEIGGVQAKSGALKTTSLLDFSPGSLGGGSLGGFSNDGSFSNLGDTSSLGNAPSAPRAVSERNTGNAPRRAAPVANVKGERGGKMAVVGLLGLVALAIVAERDRRLMRRAQRIAVEA